MNLREWANTNPKQAYGLIAACVAVAVAAVGYQLFGDSGPKVGVAPPHYYTVDDGKTFFEAPGSDVPPFDYGGKTAVQAHVFECGGRRFVGFMSRYTPEARQAVIDKKITPQMRVSGRQVKRPGDADWVAGTDFAAVGKIVNVTSPAGVSGTPVPVEP